MASKKISQLTPVTPLLTDLVPLDRPTTGAGAPVTGQATLADIQALIDTGGGVSEFWTSNLATDLIETTGSIIHDGSGNILTNGLRSVVFGSSNTGNGENILIHGESNSVNGDSSHAEGYSTSAAGFASHTEGEYSSTQMLGFQVDSIAPDGVDPTLSVFTLNSSYSDISSGIQNIGNGSAPLTYFLTNGAVSTTHEDRRVYELVGANYEGGKTHVTCSNPLGMYDYDGTILASFVPLIAQQQLYGLYPDTIISGTVAHAEGRVTSAIGSGSHAEGVFTFAIGVSTELIPNGSPYSSLGAHSEGTRTLAYGAASHAEGGSTVSIGDFSHAEGRLTTASGYKSHSEGDSTTAAGENSHAEGESTTASGTSSHAEGGNTTAVGGYSHAEGVYTVASGAGSHAEGAGAAASGNYSHAEGDSTTASGGSSHAEGTGTTASGTSSHAEGQTTSAIGDYSHAEGGSGVGGSLIAQGHYSHAEGYNTQAISDYSHAEGENTRAGYLGYPINSAIQDFINPDIYVYEIQGYGDVTAAFPGQNNEFIVDGTVCTYLGSNYISGSPNHTYVTGSGGIGFANIITRLQLASTPGGADQKMGEAQSARGYQTYAIGSGSHAEGAGTRAVSQYSHSEGDSTTASGEYSHAEGFATISKGSSSHAEGSTTISLGEFSHAEGALTVAYGDGSHAEGLGTIASGTYQHTQGQYNLRNNNFSLFVIGNGDDDSTRSDVVRVNRGTVGSGSLEVTGSLSVTVGMTGSLSYAPGNGAYWADPDPTNVKDALDRIAALLYTLNSSTPIP